METINHESDYHSYCRISLKNIIVKLTTAFPMIKLVTKIKLRWYNEYAVSFYHNKYYEERKRQLSDVAFLCN